MSAAAESIDGDEPTVAFVCSCGETVVAPLPYDSSETIKGWALRALGEHGGCNLPGIELRDMICAALRAEGRW